jgi:hypothetical protein
VPYATKAIIQDILVTEYENCPEEKETDDKSLNSFAVTSNVQDAYCDEFINFCTLTAKADIMVEKAIGALS